MSAVSGFGIIGAIVVGIIAGFIAEKVTGRNHGLLMNLIVGVIGAFIGPALLGALGLLPAGTGQTWIASIVVSAIGAIVLLFVLGLVRR